MQVSISMPIGTKIQFSAPKKYEFQFSNNGRLSSINDMPLDKLAGWEIANIITTLAIGYLK